MKRLFIATAICLTAFGAAADPSIPAASRTCSEVQAELQAAGSAIVHFRTPASSALPRYSRYVSDGRFCDSREIAIYASVPTADRPACPVRKCRAVY